MNSCDPSTTETYNRLYALYRRSWLLGNSVREASTDEERAQEVQRVYQSVMGPNATIDPAESVTVIQAKFKEHQICVYFYNQLIDEKPLVNLPKTPLTKDLPYYKWTEMIHQWLKDHRANLEQITYLQLVDFRSIPKELSSLPSLKILFLRYFTGDDYTPLTFMPETFQFLILRLLNGLYFIRIDPTASHSHRVKDQPSRIILNDKKDFSLLLDFIEPDSNDDQSV